MGWNIPQPAGLRSEILEQPAVLRRVLASQARPVAEIARAVQERQINYVFLAARGTSDHAGLYAKYLWGAVNRLPTALAAPSLFSMYRCPPRLAGALAVGISQSGQSPDIVSVLAEARRQQALTLAITNDPASPLAQACEYTLDLCAGEEKAVAATKTYSAELMTIAMLSVAMADAPPREWDVPQRMETLGQVPDLIEAALANEASIEQAAGRFQEMTQCVVLGRGYNYATAYEWSLKLKELAYLVAEPYSSADFRHGPIALVEPGFPVLAVSYSGAVQEDMLQLLGRLRGEYRADLLVISDDDRALDLAQTPLRLPAGLPEWISPLVCIAPAQLFCYHLTRAKGYDPERPRGLTKVTQTH